MRYVTETLPDMPSPRDREFCDKVFGSFTGNILYPYAESGLVSRAADFGANTLVPEVLALEKSTGNEFHKGALFYDTALAFLAIGNEPKFEYSLAMASEEDFTTNGVEGKPQNRGLHSLKTGPLSKQTIEDAVQFAAKLLNGNHSTSTVDYELVIGHKVTTSKLDTWRTNLDPFHHAELFRVLNEANVFLGTGMPAYNAVKDNPYVMLRLVKALAHLAQWIESRLTDYQKSHPAGTIRGKTLSKKLEHEPGFSSLVSAAGSAQQFSGNNPNTASDTDNELKALMSDAATATTDADKHWRILRVLYIVRNSTAHQIEDTLAFHTDHAYLTQLLQVIFVGSFVIEKLTTGNAP
nr:hypothetical protein [Rhodopirellula sp. SM50]